VKKSGILFLLLSAGIVIATASGVYYFWRQLTQLPEWYTKEQSNPQPYAQIQKSSTAVEKKIETQIQASLQPKNINSASKSPADNSSSTSGDVQVALSSSELNDLLVTKLTKKTGDQPLTSSVKGFHTSVKNDKLKTGAVVDVEDLKNSGLGSQQQALLTQIAKKFPMNDRKLYIGVEGKPEIQNGKLRFGQNAKIQVGNMSFTIAEVANRLGVTPEDVQDQLNFELKFRGLSVKNIDFQDGNAIFRGAAR